MGWGYGEGQGYVTDKSRPTLNMHGGVRMQCEEKPSIFYAVSELGGSDEENYSL